jgi:hypothetical protein
LSNERFEALALRAELVEQLTDADLRLGDVAGDRGELVDTGDHADGRAVAAGHRGEPSRDDSEVTGGGPVEGDDEVPDRSQCERSRDEWLTTGALQRAHAPAELAREVCDSGRADRLDGVEHARRVVRGLPALGRRVGAEGEVGELGGQLVGRALQQRRPVTQCPGARRPGAQRKVHVVGELAGRDAHVPRR